MAPVAKQLGLNFISLRPDAQKGFDFTLVLNQYLKKNRTPEWVIWVHRRSHPDKMLNLLEAHKIRSINITNPIPPKDANVVGKPLQRYQYWQAQISSNEYDASYKIIDALHLAAQQSNYTKPYRIIGIAGSKYLQSAKNSNLGMLTAIEQRKNMHLLQLVYSDWSQDEAFNKMNILLRRHPNINLAWAGNINIALGIRQALQASQIKTQHWPMIGNLGWHPKVFSAIQQEHIAFSMGGNHMHGVWALLVIYDIVHNSSGANAVNKEADSIINIPYIKASKHNIQHIEPLFQSSYWHTANIKQYSKRHNPQLHKYDFNLEYLLATE
ncbi:type 1 periplasmic-binding domain-containing protein [Saccharobesus litoralis]|nr:hypothetical protein [Saccharobesus litoralis]